jgi:hypothetical protein
MKKIAFLVITALMLLLSGASAKKEPVPHIYMFGMAASFTDTIVHFTAIQQIDSAWIDTKNQFLQERQAYSYQLRDYLIHQQQLPHRTCIVFYSQKREKLEKKFQKMLKLYTKSKDGLQHFDVRHLDAQQFQFRVVSAEVIEEENEEK